MNGVEDKRSKLKKVLVMTGVILMILLILYFVYVVGLAIWARVMENLTGVE